MKLCDPAMVYFVLSCIVIVMAVMKKFSVESLMIKAIYVIVWTWFLNFLCSKGYKTVSWVLVILPFIMMFGMIALIVEMGVRH
jgi:hypothetical protein